MAIFSSKKEKKEEKAVVSSTLKTPAKLFPHASVIISARITEKATKESENNIYTFNVNPSSTKTEVKEAVKSLFNVSALKVTFVPVRAKKLFQKGKRGRTSFGKKAYVSVAKGTEIEFV